MLDERTRMLRYLYVQLGLFDQRGCISLLWSLGFCFPLHLESQQHHPVRLPPCLLLATLDAALLSMEWGA